MGCPACGFADNPQVARFCAVCGARLPGDEPVREERKVVTVLFADLVGFTARAERLDPEDVRALLGPYYARLRAELERHGGTVEKFIGDAVMAIFGAPVAHEDDPERAVRAALAIRDAVVEMNEADPSLELQVRIGINTGEALVALDARPREGEGMAAGDVVNTAARLQAAAPVNGVLVSEKTYRATERAIEYRPADPVEAKGKAEPLAVWVALQARSRFGVDVPRARTPIVGREAEVETLTAALARVRREGALQLVTLVGVPGIGKSRLLAELFAAVEADPELIRWRQGRSLPYGEGVSFWALAEIVKAHAGILEGDDPAVAGEKLRAAVAGLDEAEWLESQLRPLAGLGSPQTEGGSRSEAFSAWRRFFEGLAEESPLVLVFEDLHWADDGLLDFVDYLADWASDVPILAVATARPELLERRPGWGGGKRNASTLSLGPLSDGDTARLVAALLDRSVIDAAAQAELLRRAEGNPLYAEEFVRLLAGGEPPDRLPDSVQGLIAARLDALAPEEKAVLQDAAVFGKVFWLGALERASGLGRVPLEELLHALERKEFVRRERRASVEGEREYAFRHALVRDVAYAQIPRAVRADKHRAAAEWIESLGRPEDTAEMLAHHYGSALDLAAAAGADTDALAAGARRAFREAGARASSFAAYGAAASFYARALELWPEDDPDRALVLRDLGIARWNAEGEGVEELQTAAGALEAAGRAEEAAVAALRLARALWGRGDRAAADAAQERALRLTEALRSSPVRARTLAAMAQTLHVSGRREEAIARAHEALAAPPEALTPETRIRALTAVGSAKTMLGDDEDGFADLRRAAEDAREARLYEARCIALNNRMAAAVTWGRVPEARGVLEELQADADRFPALFQRWLRAIASEALYQEGRWNEALAAADAFLAEVDAGQSHYLEAPVRATRTAIRLARGDREGARADAERALAAARGARDPQVLVFGLGCAAQAAAETEGPPAARPFVDELLAGGEPYVSALYDRPDACDTTWVAAGCGRGEELLAAVESLPRRTPWGEAARLELGGDLDGAAERYAELFAVPHEARAQLRLARALVAAGRRPEADRALARALELYRALGATAYVREAEELLRVSA